MRSAIALIAIPFTPAVLLSGATAPSASAANGRLEIIVGCLAEVINNPVGCIPVPSAE